MRLIALLLVIAGVAVAARRSAHAARLPPLPDLSGTTPAIREHLTAADQAARNSPTSSDIVGSLCFAYHADQFLDRAGRCYTALIALQPAEWRWVYYRSLAEIGRGLEEAALADLRSVVRQAPDWGPALWRLGDAEFNRRNLDAAAAHWRQARVAPDARFSPSAGPSPVAAATVADHAAVGLARIALMRGDSTEALQLLDGISARAPRFGAAWRLMGDTYRAMGRLEDARLANSTADRLPPSAPFADPATEHLVKTSRSSLFLLQQALDADLEINSAWHEFIIRRAVAFNPDNPEVVYEMSSLLRRQERHDEALMHLRRYQQMIGDPLVQAEIGSYLSQLGRFDEAEALLREAAAGPPNASVHFDLGAIRAQRGDTAGASREFERALALNPFHAAARLNLAALLLLERRLPEAARHLERVLEIDADNAKAHANLGVLLEEQGRVGPALRHFAEAVRLDPDLTLAAERIAALQKTKRSSEDFP